jgi:hypothetical protein
MAEAAAPQRRRVRLLGVWAAWLAAGAAMSQVLTPAPLTQAQQLDQRAQAEALVLRTLPQAKRHGERLLLIPARGRPVILDNRLPQPDAAAPWVDYRLQGLSGDGRFFIVQADSDGDRQWYWIARADGHVQALPGPLVAAPDGRHLVMVRASEGQGFNGIQLWERQGNRLALRFSEVPADFALYRLLRWRDASTVELAATRYAQAPGCPSGLSEALAQLSWSQGRWQLREVAGPSCQP